MIKRIISALLCTALIPIAVTAADEISIKDIAADRSHSSSSKSSYDPDELAGDILDAIKEETHPYILFGDEDIPTLRQKVNQGLSKKAYERVLATANGYLSHNISVVKGANGITGRKLQCYVTYLAMAGVISGETKYFEKAVQLTESAAKNGSVEVYSSINGALAIGDFGHAYAMAYDWLYEYMTEEQRALVKAEMEEIGEWIFVNSAEVDTWGSQLDSRKAWNWNAVTHGALGLIALSLGDKSEWLSLAIRRATDYYDFAVDNTGAAMEGLHYVGYGLNSLVPFDGAIQRLTGVELMDDYPEMQAMPEWSLLYMTYPYGGDQAAIGQGDKMANTKATYYIINRYSQAYELYGFYNTYGLFDGNGFKAEYEGDGWAYPALIIFEDQYLAPKAPTEESHPTTKLFDKGLVISRDSWDKNASMVTFTCGVGFAGCWNHPDDNTFTFAAKGDRFIIDLGANKKLSSDHNTVMIDGVGMNYEGGSTMIIGKMNECKLLKNGNLYVSGDNKDSYWKTQLKNSSRQLVFGGGEAPFVLIYDVMRRDANQHEYSINFYTAPSNKIEVLEDGAYARITGTDKDNICYVIPMSTQQVTVEASSGANMITTKTTATMLSQATLFIFEEPDGKFPDVSYNFSGKVCTVKITRTLNGELVTETYTFNMDEMTNFTTTEDLPEDTEPETSAPETSAPEETTLPEETTSPSENTTASENSDASETDAKESAEATQPVETQGESKESAGAESSDTEPQVNNNGCGAFAGGTTAAVTAAAAATVLQKKKKRKSINK